MLALCAAPAKAAAAPPSVCGVGAGPFLPETDDQTVVPTGWQQGSPPGTVDIPLLGGPDVDAFEYKVNCGSAVAVNSAPGTATVTGQGAFRFTHRAYDADADLWTDWVDSWVSIDSVNPANTTPPISSDWRRGPATFPLSGLDTTSNVVTEWSLDGGGTWTRNGAAVVDGTGSHTLITAAVDEAGNRAERTDTVRIDNDLPVDTTTTAPPIVPLPQTEPVSLTVDGTDADSGVARVEWQLDAQAPGSGPDGTVVQIATSGMHVFRTRVVDKVGNVSAWRAQNVWIDLEGPADTTVVPTTWFTTPTVQIDVTAEEEEYGIKTIEWRLDGVYGGSVNSDSVPVTIAGDGIHELEVRVTDNDDRVLDWHTHLVKIDTVHPVDLTTISSGWLPYSSLNVNVRGTDANSGIERVEWRIGGGNVGSAAGSSQDVLVTGDGVVTLETRVVDNAGLASAWTARTIKLDATAPTNTTDVAPVGWRNTPYSVVLSGTDASSGIAAVGWKVQLDGQPETAETLGATGATTAAITVDGSHVLSTRVHDVAGNASNWRTELIQIDRVAPVDATVYPTAPVANRHLITFTTTDDRSGVAGVEWRLDGGAVKTTPSARIAGAGEHTLEVRVRDNAGNWSAWGTHTVTVVLGPDSTPPTDNTTLPTQWVTSAWTVKVEASDDIDGVGIDYVEWRLDDDEIQSGPAGSTFVVTADGVHDVDTRVWDKAGNHTDWKTQTLRVDRTKPVDETALPAGWAATRAVTLAASDVASGVDRITYDVSGAGTLTGQLGPGGGTITLPADGTYTLSYSIFDVAGQRLNRSVIYKVDTVVPVNTSAAAPTAWQTAALSLALTGTDALSGVDHAEWRVGGGSVQTGTPAVVAAQGQQLLETRIVDKAGNASAWRSETVRVDTTKPLNTTPAVGEPWRKTTFTTTVSGSDAHSGVARTEYRIDAGGVVTGAAVSIAAEGAHTLETRVVDVAGNASDWRADAIGIDKVAPALAVDCGPSGWRNTVPVCAVSASGGPSGLPTLTAAIGNGAPVPVTTSFAVDAEGASTVSFRAVDGAGNQSTARADVKIDRTPPSASLRCVPGSGTAWACTPSGADALSGIGGLTWSLDGSAPVAVGAGTTFAVQKGTVVVYATDAAGNRTASAPVKLASREAGGSSGGDSGGPTPRSTNEAVLLRKRSAKSSSRLVGQFAIAALPTKTTLDLRPLALGKGKFRFVFKLNQDGKKRTITKTQTTKSGYSKRIKVTVRAAAKTTVTLTISKRSGRRWVSHATASAKL